MVETEELGDPKRLEPCHEDYEDFDDPVLIPKERTKCPRPCRDLPAFYGLPNEDPIVHLREYNLTSLASGFDNIHPLLVFSSTLKEEARKWYWSLPRGSIKSFEQLCDKFLDEYKKQLPMTQVLG